MDLELLQKCLLDQIYDPTPARIEGKDIPARAMTMVGEKRLNSLCDLLEIIRYQPVAGDYVDCGTWRGGCAIIMAYCAAEYVYDFYDDVRLVWVCDSFEGLPPPEWEQDAGDGHHTRKELAVSLEEVQENFRRFDLLDDNVKFLKGWFKDTLPTAPIEKIALLRVDADMYGSTMDVLNALYHKVVPGGYVIIDDYKLPRCKQAVTDFREKHGISDEIITIDWTGIYWRKS